MMASMVSSWAITQMQPKATNDILLLTSARAIDTWPLSHALSTSSLFVFLPPSLPYVIPKRLLTAVASSEITAKLPWRLLIFARPSGVVSDTGKVRSHNFSSFSSSSSRSSKSFTISDCDNSPLSACLLADSFAMIFLRSFLRDSLMRSTSATIGSMASELMADLPAEGGCDVMT